MDAFERDVQNGDVANARNKVLNINNACAVIKQKCLELNAMAVDWQEKVTAGTYSQDDLDALESQRAGLTDLYDAVNTYLTP